MRADRLIALALLLQTRGRLTAQEIANRLEVSVRTVYRDLDALSAAGIPVVAESGPGGGITLPDGYRVDLTALNQDEARALFLGTSPGSLGPLEALGVAPVLDAALRKLSAALPTTTRHAAERARQRLLVDPADWWEVPPPAPPALRAVEEAVWREQRMRFTYTRWGPGAEAAGVAGKSAQRLVDPYALVVKHGAWYLIAAPVRDSPPGMPKQPPDEGPPEAPAPERPAVFRISRMRDVTLTDEPSVRVAGFDLVEFWAQACVEFRATRPKLAARVRATPEVARRLARIFAAGAPLPEPDGDGRYTLAVDLQTEDIACHELLGHGPQVEVLEPASLRHRLAANLRAAAALYG